MCIPRYLFSQSASFIMEFLFWVSCWFQLTTVIAIRLFIFISSSCWIMLNSRPEKTKLSWNFASTLQRICVFWQSYKLPSAEDFGEYNMTWSAQELGRLWMEFLMIYSSGQRPTFFQLVSLVNIWDVSRGKLFAKICRKTKLRSACWTSNMLIRDFAIWCLHCKKIIPKSKLRSECAVWSEPLLTAYILIEVFLWHEITSISAPQIKWLNL